MTLVANHYQFDEFFVDGARRLLLKGRETIALNDRAFDVLLLLIRNAGQVVTREDFLETVWRDVSVEPGNIDQAILALRKALGDTSEPRRYIKTVPRRGFQFVAKVAIVDVDSGPPETDLADGREILAKEPVTAIEPTTEEARKRSSVRLNHLGHLALSCTLYALLYALAVPLEVAYQWDTFEPTAKKTALLVFLWVLLTSIGGLVVDQRLTYHGKRSGLLSSILIFFVAAILLLAALTFYLPPFPVTKSTFQALPAQAAYLKNTSYFFLLAIIFLVIPFHFVSALENETKHNKHRRVLEVLTGKAYGVLPRGAFYPRLWALVLLLAAFLPISLSMTSRLLDHLQPSPFMNLFTQLVYVRALLYFALGTECLIWYQRALNEIKRDCLAREGEDQK